MSGDNATWSNSSLTTQSMGDVSDNAVTTPDLTSTQEPDPDSSVSFWREAAELTYKFGYPSILAFGITGNVLTLLVLGRMRSDSSSFVVFFTALAVSDLCLLCVGLVPIWVDNQFHISVYNFHQVTCKLFFWLLYIFGALSAWLLTAMTIQRAVSVIWPHKVRSSCTKRQAYVTITALVTTLAVVEAQLLYALDIHPQAGVCFFIDSYLENFLDLWVWMDLWLQCLLPFCVLVVSNSVLVWSVVRSARRARRNLGGEEGAGAGAGQVAARERKASSMTLTLMAVSAAFILLTSPVAVSSLVTYYMGRASADYGSRYPYLKFMQAFTNLLWYANSSFNLVLYVLTGTRFRQEFKAMLGLADRSGTGGKGTQRGHKPGGVSGQKGGNRTESTKSSNSMETF